MAPRQRGIFYARTRTELARVSGARKK